VLNDSVPKTTPVSQCQKEHHSLTPQHSGHHIIPLMKFLRLRYGPRHPLTWLHNPCIFAQSL